MSGDFLKENDFGHVGFVSLSPNAADKHWRSYTLPLNNDFQSFNKNITSKTILTW